MLLAKTHREKIMFEILEKCYFSRDLNKSTKKNPEYSAARQNPIFQKCTELFLSTEDAVYWFRGSEFCLRRSSAMHRFNNPLNFPLNPLPQTTHFSILIFKIPNCSTNTITLTLTDGRGYNQIFRNKQLGKKYAPKATIRI